MGQFEYKISPCLEAVPCPGRCWGGELLLAYWVIGRVLFFLLSTVLLSTKEPQGFQKAQTPGPHLALADLNPTSYKPHPPAGAMTSLNHACVSVEYSNPWCTTFVFPHGCLSWECVKGRVRGQACYPWISVDSLIKDF